MGAAKGLTMTKTPPTQQELWNNRTGEKWVAFQPELDVMLANVTTRLMARAAIQPGERVLDIGCGTGQSCALALEQGATVTGVDVSGPMLKLAAKRLGERATLCLADAGQWVADKPFDIALSRFGVMFFDDPVAAMTRIRGNLKPGGRLVFCCWQAMALNDWANVPAQAIADLLDPAPPSDPLTPGPFAFADDERLHLILAAAGYTNIEIVPLTVDIVLTDQGGPDHAARLTAQIGPAAAAMAAWDEARKATAFAHIRDAIAARCNADRVVLSGAIWLVRAQA